MKQEQTSRRRRALRALVLLATTGALACADADETTPREALARQAGALDGAVVSAADAGVDAAADAAARAPTLTKVSVAEGLAGPESAHFDERSKCWFVSNVGAQRVAGDGFIARLDAKGSLLQREFVRGLNDPKGIAVHEGVLYVADNTELVRIPLATPESVERIAVPGAVLLNDVVATVWEGAIYVSDTLGNAIYRYRPRDGSIVEVLRSPELEAPNGLAVEEMPPWRPTRLLVATIGPNLDPATFATTAPGRVLRLDTVTRAITPATDPLGVLDGIEVLPSRDDGTAPIAVGWLVSNFRAGVLYVDPDGRTTQLQDSAADGLRSAADIGVSSTGLVAVPDVAGTQVIFYQLAR